MNVHDEESLNTAFGNLSDTLLRQRMMRQEAARQQQAQAIDQSRYNQSEADRQVQLSLDKQRLDAQAKNYQSEAEARKAAATSRDTATTAKASKVFYAVSPSTKNVMSYSGTPDDAQKWFQSIQAKTPSEGMVLTDKEPESLKDLNEIKVDDNTTLHASDADAAKYYSHKADLLQKAQAQKQPPLSAQPHQQVEQHMNPLYFGTGGNQADPKQPEFINTTNSYTPLNIGDSGLPNVAPAQSPAAAKPAAKPTPQDVSYLAAHPEMKAKFEARFGAGTADQYLP